MQATFLPLLANSDADTSGPVFWVLLVAVIVWYLIWRLLRRDSESLETIDSPPRSDSPAGTIATSAADADSFRSDDAGAAPDSTISATAAAAGTSAVAASAAAASPPETATIPDSGEPSPDSPFAPPTVESEASAPDSPESASSESSVAEDLEEEPLPEIETASAEQAGEQFKAEIESGNARLDQSFGVVFTAAPDKADDLKKIKGVGNVLEGKLNEHGVYTYRQIAFWTDAAVREFSKMLTSFKDRIYRDNWIAQAKALHEKHHGENL